MYVSQERKIDHQSPNCWVPVAFLEHHLCSIDLDLRLCWNSLLETEGLRPYSLVLSLYLLMPYSWPSNVILNLFISSMHLWASKFELPEYPCKLSPGGIPSSRSIRETCPSKAWTICLVSNKFLNFCFESLSKYFSYCELNCSVFRRTILQL